MHFVQVIPPTCLLMTTEWYPMWLFLIISSVGFFSKVASLVLSAMRTFPEKHQVRICFFIIKESRCYNSAWSYDKMIEEQYNESSENN